MPSFLQSVMFLCVGIVVIILLTVKFHIHTFFALMIACFVTGVGLEIPVADIVNAMKDGFGNIMRSLGFIIVLGTTLGVLIEHTGSTQVMANFILKKTGERNTALALSLTGFIIGLPVFCDSGFIVLSGLNTSLAKKSGVSIAVTSAALATGLYAVHCLVPPHPGVSAAAGIIHVDIGKLMLTGIGVALPAMLVGNYWARYAGRKISIKIDEKIVPVTEMQLPSTVQAFLPVLIPVILIACKAFFNVDNAASIIRGIANIAGDPVIALAIGVLLACIPVKDFKKDVTTKLFTEGVEKAGSILVIIGAGGAFGALLAAAKIGDHFSQLSSISNMGIFFPFLVTTVLKTAQGSSTVAVITAASIIQPLLNTLHLNSDWGRLLCVLSMGAGSMTFSHVNDAYFWVILKFSNLDMRSVLKVYSIATLLMGLITLLTIYIVSIFVL